MSVQQAQQWLEKHTHSIPSLSHNHNAILRLLDDDKQSNKVNQYLDNDPGMILALLCKVNIQRQSGTARSIVESPQAAMALLGEQVSANLFRDIAVAEQCLTQPHQLFLFQQLINRCLHNRQQAMAWADRLGYQQLEATAITALLVYLGELLCCTHDFPRYLKCIEAQDKHEAVQSNFGFSFDQLTEAVCQSRNLPEPISLSLASSDDPGQKTRLIAFTSRICEISEQGWYHERMLQTLDEFAEFLRLPVDNVVSQTHQFAVDAARSSFIADAWQPASRLLLLADAAWSPQLPAQTAPAKTTATETVQAKPADFSNRLKQQLQRPDLSQMELLQFCIHSLQQDLGLSRLSVMLLSKDNQWIQQRLALGFGNDSPLAKFRIETERSGIFKMLLQQPQSLLINDGNLKKYQKLIPQRFLASIMTTNFMAMSLFIGNKPVAIIYADRSTDNQGISVAHYQKFKHSIGLTSKALTLLAKRQQSAKA